MTPSETNEGVVRTPIVEALRATAGESLTPDELFGRCGYSDEQVDLFFEELHQAIEDGRVEQNRPDTETVFLRAIVE